MIMEKCDFGFRRDKSTINTIHLMRQITETGYEHNMHILFIDIKLAVDKLRGAKIIGDLET